MSKFIGIDISKQTFDVCFSNGRHQVLKNTLQGFKKLEGQIDTDSKIVMEASGPYYLRLANFLYEKKITVFVENPLKIKRFSQMNFNRAKTDKKDAKVIRDFGLQMKDHLREWKPEPVHIKDLRQIHSYIELVNKQIGQTSRQLESFRDSGNINNKVENKLEKLLTELKEQKKELEQEMETICKREHPQTLESLTSIPGIGNKTAIMLIVLTDDFKKFEHYKQLIAYVGFSPRIYQSGTSVRGKSHICKMGKSQIRKLLYVCSWTAKRYNKSCIEMYDRLKKKGKPERVIKIALANKLLKQSFAIGKNKRIYSENYCSEFIENRC